MFKVGLTGGIASGKSTISQHFAQLGVPVIDTDVISHQLMQPGEAAYQLSIEHFGTRILNHDKSIDRGLLRKLIFDNPEQRAWLERMIHPLIRERSQQAMNDAKDSDYVLLVVPLMFESGFEELIDHVVVIDCTESVQLARLQARDKIDEQLARQMLAAQLTNQQRLQRADSVIVNNDDQSRLADVMALHARLVGLSERHRAD